MNDLIIFISGLFIGIALVISILYYYIPSWKRQIIKECVVDGISVKETK